MKKIISFIAFISFFIGVQAANVCVGVSNTGSGNGSDWNNQIAKSNVTNGGVRGNTYYVADGAYTGGISATTAPSSTTMIIWRKATVADHGTATGWLDAYGDGQATFTAPFAVTTSYWLFDGQAGQGTGSVVPYGFQILTGQGFSAMAMDGNTGSTPLFHLTNVTMQYIDAAGVASLVDFNYTSGTKPCYFGYADNCTVTHCYIHGGETLCDTETGAHTVDSNNVVVTYCYLQASRSSNPSFHSNVFFISGSNGGTFAFNVVFNYNDEGVFFSGFNHVVDDWKIYGNVFDGTIGGGVPRGVEMRQDFDISNILCYNNTCINLSNSITNRASENGQHSTGCAIVNTLVYNAPLNVGDTTTVLTNSTAGSTSVFVNYAAQNYHLASDVSAWTALSSPYNVDMDGVTRTSSRGAYQFVTAGGSGGSSYKGQISFSGNISIH